MLAEETDEALLGDPKDMAGRWVVGQTKRSYHPLGRELQAETRKK